MDTSWADPLKRVSRNGKGDSMATKLRPRATGVRSATKIINSRVAKQAKAVTKPPVKQVKPKSVKSVKSRANKMFDSF